MIRKFGLTLLALLLIGLPVSAAFGKEAHAASSSRIAVIQKLSGDVQVQKAGGSKQFKAFAKLSLNQGDKLVTGSEGSALLQFANGTSEDDKFTVGENATLTFSKLSDKKGTVTKVSMLKGTAWVDVKSIKSKDDDFQLETPTAIMGVRGTAFFASVNPATGGTNTAVLSGVVRYTTGGALPGGNGAGGDLPGGPHSGSGDSRTIDLYPTQQISSDPGSSGPLSERTHIVDIENLVRGASPEVIEALLRSKAKIDEENRQSVEAFKRSGVPDGLQQTLDQFIQLTQALLGVFAKQAVDQRKLELSTVRQIEQQESTSFDLTKDRLELTDVQLKQQEAAKQKQKEAAAKKAAEEAAAKQELEGKLAGQLKAIEASKQAQAEANRRIAAEAAAKAEAALLGTLTPVQRQQYDKDKASRGTPAPTPTPLAGVEPTPPPDDGPGKTPPPGSDDARLKGLTLSAGAQLSPAFAADVVSYSVNVGSGVAAIELTPSSQDPAAAVSVNGAQWKGGAVRVPLAYGDNEIKLAVTAPNGSATRVYTITATRHLLDSADIEVQGLSPLHIDFTAAIPATAFDVPSDADRLTLKLPLAEKPRVTVNGVQVSPNEEPPAVTAAFTTSAAFADSPAVAAANTRNYSVPLQEGANTIVIEAKVGAAVKSYTLVANRAEAFRAEDGYAETDYNQPFTGKLKSRGGGGDVRYEIVENSENGVVVLDPADSSAFTYTPADEYAGVDSFSFKAISGGIESAPATIVIRVKPLEIEVKGLVSSAIAWGEVPVEATYLSGYEDGSYKRKYYGLFVDDEDSRLIMHFVFDRAMVTDARLIFGEDIIGQAEDGSLVGDFALDQPFATVRLTFSAAQEDRNVSYEINYIVIRQQSWAAALPTEGKAALHLVPVKGGDYTVNVRGKDEKLLLRSYNLSTEIASDVWIDESGKTRQDDPKKRVKARLNGEGYYEVPLVQGWNQAEIRTYFPGSEGSAQVRTVHIWRGDGLPEGYGMTGVQGTPVQYPPQASTAPKAFIRDESQQSVYRVALPADSVAVDVKPVPGAGLKIDAVYQGGYASFQRVEPYPEGSDRYQVQLYGDWNNYGFVVVSPVAGSPPFAYTLDMEKGLTLDVDANIFYKQGSQAAKVSLGPFEGGLQGILAGAPDQAGFELRMNVADERASVWVNDILVPYNANGFYFAYSFTPEAGDNVFRITVTDRYGRHGSLDVYLFYEAQELP